MISRLLRIPDPLIDCKTVGFFLKISKEIGNVWRKTLMRTNQSRSLFSALFHTFCLTARAYLNTQKYWLFCSLRSTAHRGSFHVWKPAISFNRLETLDTASFSKWSQSLRLKVRKNPFETKASTSGCVVGLAYRCNSGVLMQSRVQNRRAFW